MKTISILDVPFHPLPLQEVVHRMNDLCEGKGQYFIVTPNPEICLLATRDTGYRTLLRSAELSIPDGFGILWAARYLKGSRNFFRLIWTLLTPAQTLRNSGFPERVTGTDVMKEFCKTFPKRKIFLLGASPKVNENISNRLKSEGVTVVGNYSGDDTTDQEVLIRKKIIDSGAEVLFVAFGAPKQEQWIRRNLSFLKSVKIAMGIGGAFDFLAGEKKRAPHWMRRFGLEWLFRLCIEPRRIRRIFNATFVFPWMIYRRS